MRTLEEAIKHCEEVADQLEGKDGYAHTDSTCDECASEHRQHAEWLRALKEIWDSGDCNDCRNGQCEWKPKLGQLVRFNCPHYAEIETENIDINLDNVEVCDEARYKPVDTPKTYICDPEKNTECEKTHCQTLCFRTTEPKYRKIDEVNKEMK